jgi:hypothetical protein
LFVRTIEHLAPEVLDELWELFRQCSASHGLIPQFAKEMSRDRPLEVRAHWGSRIWDPWDPFTWVDLQKASGDFYPELILMRSALEDWAEKRHIKTDWMLEVGLRTLQFWELCTLVFYERSLPDASRGPEEIDPETHAMLWDKALERLRTIPDDERDRRAGRQGLQFSSVDAKSLFTRDEIRFGFEHYGWDPTEISWPDYRCQILGRFEQYLNEYRGRLSALAVSKGCTPSPKKRAPDHFQWFVRYQVQLESLDSVAEKVGQAKNTVWNALKAVEKQIGLKLRGHPKGGKPRGRAKGIRTGPPNRR